MRFTSQPNRIPHSGIDAQPMGRTDLSPERPAPADRVGTSRPPGDHRATTEHRPTTRRPPLEDASSTRRTSALVCCDSSPSYISRGPLFTDNRNCTGHVLTELRALGLPGLPHQAFISAHSSTYAIKAKRGLNSAPDIHLRATCAYIITNTLASCAPRDSGIEANVHAPVGRFTKAHLHTRFATCRTHSGSS
jgi:hypothetical protein